MSYDPYAQFLEVMNDLASARRECRHLLNLFEWEQDRYGDLSIRIRDRVGGLPAIEVMIEASFRLAKWVQHGDYANQRDASNLWLAAARNFGQVALDRGVGSFQSGLEPDLAATATGFDPD